jgi:hypothetical protein
MNSGTWRVPEVLIRVVIAGFLGTRSLAFLPHHLAFRHHLFQSPQSHTAHTRNQQPTWATFQQCDDLSTIDDDSCMKRILTTCHRGPVGASPYKAKQHNNNKDLATIVSSFVSQFTTVTMSTAMTILLCTSMTFGMTNTMAWAADLAESSSSASVLLQSSPKQQPNRDSLVDEVGGLINKYYIDRTYNKQVCSLGFQKIRNEYSKKYFCATQTERRFFLTSFL